jgi:ComF family protein
MKGALWTLLRQASWLGQGFLELIYPGCCFLCGEQIHDGSPSLCSSCRAALTFDPYSACPRCATTIGPFTLTSKGCPYCQKHKFSFDGALRLGLYKDQLQHLVLMLKRPRAAFLAPLIARLWFERDEERFREFHADAVVPIPSHWQRWLWRGINPMDAVAQELARLLGIPCRPGWLRRIRFTPMQHRLRPDQDRLRNVEDAFAVPGKIRLDGKTLLLLDDVLTSGATANEAARPLLRAGAAHVVVIVLARTPLHL